MTATRTTALVDRAALVRGALRTLVAQRGFRGATMSAIARRAGVATGTAYTHYASKDALVLAAYREAKAELGAAATAELADDLGAAERFLAIWIRVHRHLAARIDDARFLLAVDHSPYRARLHAEVLAGGDALVAEAARLGDALRPFGIEILWELGLCPAVRLAAAGIELGDREREAVAAACWRAVARRADSD